jgi:hypothetical protein
MEPHNQQSMSKPRITHVFSGPTNDPETSRRIALAKQSWAREAESYGNWREVDFSDVPTARNAQSIGDPVPLPFIHDMVEACMDGADDDIIFITNSDIGIYHGIGDELAKLCGEKGACYAYRWDFPKLEGMLATKEDIGKGRWYIGADAFAFTKRWWMANRHELPDFVLGRECWDWILRVLIGETGGVELQRAIYHEKHDSPWKKNRAMQPGNVYNRSFARAWLTVRKLPLREIANAPYSAVWYAKWKGSRPAPVSDASKMDVLIVLGPGSKWANNELKYCLRSIEKHAKNVGKVFVVGNNPGFLSNEVNMVKRDDVAGTNKEHRIAEQIQWAAANLPMTEHFLWVNDDTFFLQDTDITGYPYYNDGDLGSKWARTRMNGYRVALTQTDAQLKSRKLPTINYEIHVPIVYSRDGMSKMGKWIALSSKVRYGMTFRSLYCNALGIKPGPHYKDMKLGSTQTAEELKTAIAGRHCFSIGDGLGDGAKAYLEELFPNKSKYEI